MTDPLDNLKQVHGWIPDHACALKHSPSLGVPAVTQRARIALFVICPTGRAPRTEERPLIREDELLDRITVRPDVFGGKPIIRDMRIAVEHVLANLAAGETVESLLEDYPFLEPDDIRACLLFAHRSLAGEHVHDHVAVRGAS